MNRRLALISVTFFFLIVSCNLGCSLLVTDDPAASIDTSLVDDTSFDQDTSADTSLDVDTSVMGVDTSQEEQDFATVCLDAREVLFEEFVFQRLDSNAAQTNFLEADICSGNPVSGGESFYRLDAQAGQHFELTLDANSGAHGTITVIPACATPKCLAAVMPTIPTMFTAPKTGSYYLMVDSNNTAFGYSLKVEDKPCFDVTCSGDDHGTCAPSADGPVCNCITPYQNDELDPLACVKSGIIVRDGGITVVDHDSTVDFGAVEVLEGAVTKTFTISNTGSSTLTVNSIQFTPGADFSFSSTNTPPFTLQGTEVAEFEVRYAPNLLGDHTGTISISSSDFDQPNLTFTLSGNGEDTTAPEVENKNINVEVSSCEALELSWELATKDNYSSNAALEYAVYRADEGKPLETLADLYTAHTVVGWTADTTEKTLWNVPPEKIKNYVVAVRDEAGNVAIYNAVETEPETCTWEDSLVMIHSAGTPAAMGIIVSTGAVITQGTIASSFSPASIEIVLRDGNDLGALNSTEPYVIHPGFDEDLNDDNGLHNQIVLLMLETPIPTHLKIFRQPGDIPETSDEFTFHTFNTNHDFVNYPIRKLEQGECEEYLLRTSLMQDPTNNFCVSYLDLPGEKTFYGAVYNSEKEFVGFDLWSYKVDYMPQPDSPLLVEDINALWDWMTQMLVDRSLEP